MELGLVMVFAEDLPAMVAFYRQVLGRAPEPHSLSDDWAEFTLGPVRLGIHAIPAGEAPPPTSGAPAAREENPVKVVLTVDDLDTVTAAVTAAGGTVLNRPWGGVDVVDPEGNVVGLSVRDAAAC